MAAVFYDGFLLLAIWFVATALILPFNAGEAFNSGQYFYPLYLLAVAFGFYGWFWTHGGQTLGLKAWKIRVADKAGGKLGWRRAGVRFIGGLLSWAIFGLGFAWCLIDKEGLAWHDRLSGTRLFFLDGPG
ncbi:hypothetical protein BJL95_11940 [Methylomonas sp. LWB]|uniref:RDD domain-containing protein n=2 Tax=Methylococcaceae TaxID=403 RepID=A0A177NZ89_9GAMM|nr:hypothetical protein A1355_02415 [Methylomonas koyamae]OHX34962.1 hypothetical protein BJL95_11940 [Methylomonas sp. LWB]